ncbi:MAG: L-aspartate oxidase [Pseudomonadales bacterium]|nr:L-aspartate oxidase [Pseudomonadales bacterium]MDB2410196.1 L-aspartate oxidase [Pseudomonadales bacterium]MDG1938203.1 L-aspartate oxidase [Pseudomonadales bacterium]MDG2036477.1 L-aspartate oxidase [Pseudomonadales bacterium]
MSTVKQYDVVVIGSGAAGLTLALALAEKANVAVISKSRLSEGSTYYAQGGIAAVLDATDSIDAHCADTLVAGAGLCHEDAVRFTVERSKQAIEWLIGQGVAFTREKKQNPKSGDLYDESGNDYHLAREGGHSSRRIIHAADATGKAVSETLVERLYENPSIKTFEHHVAIDITVERDSPTPTCGGVYVLNSKNNKVETFHARYVVIATGGASKAYLYTSNPDGASGDGIAMAWRAGCRVANMEFNQFHPTCLYHPQAKSFLITEAVRGEGGKLRLPNGEQFMHRFDERGELAPRDIVARAIDHEMKRLGSDCVYLDISHREPEFIQSHFPNIYQRCLDLGIDMCKEPIPVVPAAHYTCGGIMVDNRSSTDVKNLYAIGETSFTGLHGANRMASNSLLECIVYAQAAAESILSTIDNTEWQKAPKIWDETQVTDSDEDVVISHNWDELRRFMWDYVGIVRTSKRLERAQHRAQLLRKEISEYYGNYKVTNDLIELRNLTLVAELIIESALRRKESRGLHYTLDFQTENRFAHDTVLFPPKYCGLNE